MNIFGGLGLGQGATVQLVFKTEDGTPPKTATVKAGGNETETLPLYTNKSTVLGEVNLNRCLTHRGLVFLGKYCFYSQPLCLKPQRGITPLSQCQ